MARQIALPQIGLEGQERIAGATVLVAGDDLACEVVARGLAAAGVGRLRLLRRGGPLSAAVTAALASSNPSVQIETCPWPAAARQWVADGEWTSSDEGAKSDTDAAPAGGAAWLAALDGVDAVVRSGFDDDPLLRAAIRLAVPVVVMRASEDGIDVVSFRRHGPCPHQDLDVPERKGAPLLEDAAGAVVAAHLAAAETLVGLAGAATGDGRARLLRIPVPASGAAGLAVRAVDLPWIPSCFACGGSGVEMTFS